MLEVKNLKKNYRTMDAVNNVSLKLEDGVSYALVGESGCGKSTLSKLIMGLIAPTSGEIVLNGSNIIHSKKINERSNPPAMLGRIE